MVVERLTMTHAPLGKVVLQIAPLPPLTAENLL